MATLKYTGLLENPMVQGYGHFTPDEEKEVDDITAGAFNNPECEAEGWIVGDGLEGGVVGAMALRRRKEEDDARRAGMTEEELRRDDEMMKQREEDEKAEQMRNPAPAPAARRATPQPPEPPERPRWRR